MECERHSKIIMLCFAVTFSYFSCCHSEEVIKLISPDYDIRAISVYKDWVVTNLKIQEDTMLFLSYKWQNTCNIIRPPIMSIFESEKTSHLLLDPQIAPGGETQQPILHFFFDFYRSHVSENIFRSDEPTTLILCGIKNDFSLLYKKHFPVDIVKTEHGLWDLLQRGYYRCTLHEGNIFTPYRVILNLHTDEFNLVNLRDGQVSSVVYPGLAQRYEYLTIVPLSDSSCIPILGKIPNSHDSTEKTALFDVILLNRDSLSGLFNITTNRYKINSRFCPDVYLSLQRRLIGLSLLEDKSIMSYIDLYRDSGKIIPISDLGTFNKTYQKYLVKKDGKLYFYEYIASMENYGLIEKVALPNADMEINSYDYDNVILLTREQKLCVYYPAEKRYFDLSLPQSIPLTNTVWYRKLIECNDLP